MAQKRSSEFLLAAPGIQHRVPRRTALTHPVLQPTGSPSRKGPRGYPSAFRGQAAEPRCAPPVSRARVCRPALRFPPQGPPRRVPLLQRYYQSATTSCRPSRRTSLPSLGGTSACTRSFRSPADECAAGAWSWSPGSSGRDIRRGDDRTSQVPGDPRWPVCRVQSTPAGRRSPDRYSAAAWPLVCVKQRLPRKVFRRSIARLSDSLSTLRRVSYPTRRKTRFQPLVRRYWTGFYPQGSNERFQSAYISSSFPELCLAQTHRPAQPASPSDLRALATWACPQRSKGPERAGLRPPPGETSRSPRGRLPRMTDVTRILCAIEQGDPQAAAQL